MPEPFEPRREDEQLTELGQRLARTLGPAFTVERVLGVGGFATVFRVHDASLNRPLAVKVLHPDYVASATTRERFQREAETIARLTHPNVVQVHFIGSVDDLVYIAMPCVEGGSLADRIGAGRLAVAEAVRVLRDVIGGVAHAHARGVVHRDIKAQNVLLDEDSGRALVTDFGIARTHDGGDLTSAGLMIGTPAYLSPEQVSGERGDHRVDIYALGVLAYELLTGKLPFTGPGMAALIMRFDGPPAAPSTLRPEVPAFLDAMVARALAVDPAERYQTATEMLADLESGVTGETQLLRSGASGTAHPRGRAPERNRLLAGGSVAALAVAAIVWAVFGAGESTVAADSASDDSSAQFALIVAGEYSIGEDAGPLDARPRHSVRLTAFEIGRREVTVGEYATFTDSTAAAIAEPAASLPVTGVSHDEAARFCAAMVPGGRLPTEAEWEAAARGLTARQTPWRTGSPGPHANVESAGRSGPVAVGTFLGGATPEGVTDLIGNVWEWTASAYAPYPGGRVRPVAAGNHHVIRGGAHDTPDSLAVPWVRGYARDDATPNALTRTGFRCARSVEALQR